MTTIRYAAFTLAAITLWCLTWTPPDNPAAFWLAGFFLTCFGIVAWTCRTPRRRNVPD